MVGKIRISFYTSQLERSAELMASSRAQILFVLSLILLVLFMKETSAIDILSDSLPSNHEQAAYDIYYHWGPVQLLAATAGFQTTRDSLDGLDILKLESTGSSLKSYDWLYKVRDTFACCLDPQALQPLQYKRKTLEGSTKSQNEYYFNPDKNQIIINYQEDGKPSYCDTLTSNETVFDVLSATYVARKLILDLHQPGDSVMIRILMGGQVHKIYIYHEEETQLQLRSGETIRAIKISATLPQGSIFKAGERIFAWISLDEKRVPLKIEAQIIIGKVTAILKSYQSSRNAIKYYNK